MSLFRFYMYFCTIKSIDMNRISQKIETLGGIISTADMASEAEYKRIHRAAQRGELTKLRAGVYASPDALLDTMLDIGRVVPGGVVCLYNAWSHYRLTTTVSPSFCVAIERKRKLVIPPNTSHHALLLERRESLSWCDGNCIVMAYSTHY